jgi:hypothetical protein
MSIRLFPALRRWRKSPALSHPNFSADQEGLRAARRAKEFLESPAWHLLDEVLSQMREEALNFPPPDSAEAGYRGHLDRRVGKAAAIDEFYVKLTQLRERIERRLAAQA